MSTSTTADRQYVWHPYYIDALAISYNSSGTAHYYVQDGNFNVTAAMDSSGSVIERYSYTPYGECIVLNADFTLDSSSGGDGLSDIANEFTYTGRRLDVETGLYQYRNRYYHAQLGRFVNRDPIGYEGSEWNLYEYVEGIPISALDPFGTIVINPITGAALAALAPCIAGAITAALADAAVQYGLCCYNQVGIKIWKCNPSLCQYDPCVGALSAGIGCISGYFGGPKPTTVQGLIFLLKKIGAGGAAKALGKLGCPLAPAMPPAPPLPKLPLGPIAGTCPL